jgi:betaine-aldehyde dehydrogenase
MSQFIDGKICDALSGRTGVVRDPSTGEVLSEITQAGAEDVDRAVQAARNAYAEWSRATPADRSAVLSTFARLLSDRAVEIAQLESRIAGKPIRLASELPGTIDNVAFFAGAARNLEGKASAEYSADHTSSIRREPVGVVGSISPWNFPLQMAAWKILPAIAAGNTIVLKPSELTPLTSLLFAEIGTEACLPAPGRGERADGFGRGLRRDAARPSRR